MILKDFRKLVGREDAGFLLETFVFLELNQLLDATSQIRFWRTKDGKEVDFIFLKNRVAYPIEVKTKIKIGELPSGLTSFLRRYPDTKAAFVLNLNTEGKAMLDQITIHYKKIAKTAQFLAWIAARP